VCRDCLSQLNNDREAGHKMHTGLLSVRSRPEVEEGGTVPIQALPIFVGIKSRYVFVANVVLVKSWSSPEMNASLDCSMHCLTAH
jgi:hypothetical protein